MDEGSVVGLLVVSLTPCTEIDVLLFSAASMIAFIVATALPRVPKRIAPIAGLNDALAETTLDITTSCLELTVGIEPT